MRHRESGFCNSRSLGIGLGFTGMQISDAAHGHSQQMVTSMPSAWAAATGSAAMVEG